MGLAETENFGAEVSGITEYFGNGALLFRTS